MSNEQWKIRVLIARVKSRHHADIIGTVGIFTGIVGLLGGIPIYRVGIIRPIGALIIPFSIAFGVYGILGVATGTLVSRFLQGSVGANEVIVVLTYVVMGLVTVALWDSFVDGERNGMQRGASYISRYMIVSIVASMVGAVTLSWLHELLALIPFFMAPLYALTFTVAAVAIGGPVFLATELILRHRNWKRPSLRGSRASAWWLVVTTLIWFALGTGGSALYQGFDAILTDYPHWFTSAGIGPVEILYNNALFGIGAARIQTVLGSVCMAIILTAVGRSQIGRQEDKE